MITTVINLIGSPGTGKSTIASELFAKMTLFEYKRYNYVKCYEIRRRKR